MLLTQTIIEWNPTYQYIDSSGRLLGIQMLRLNSDETLVRRAIDGSERAWLSLVRRYERPIYNYCLRMTMQKDDALDLVQDVFLSIYKSLHSFRFESQFLTWALKIAHYRAVDFLRKKKLTLSLDTSELSFEIECDHPGCKNPRDLVLDNKQNRQLLSLLATLSPDQRLVVELKFFQEFTFEEIAQQLDIPANTAKTRLYSALRQLRQTMEV